MAGYEYNPRVTIRFAPGYEDGWTATLVAHTQTVDGRAVAIVEADDGTMHVIPEHHVHEEE